MYSAEWQVTSGNARRSQPCFCTCRKPLRKAVTDTILLNHFFSVARAMFETYYCWANLIHSVSTYRSGGQTGVLSDGTLRATYLGQNLLVNFSYLLWGGWLLCTFGPLPGHACSGGGTECGKECTSAFREGTWVVPERVGRDHKP